MGLLTGTCLIGAWWPPLNGAPGGLPAISLAEIWLLVRPQRNATNSGRTYLNARVIVKGLIGLTHTVDDEQIASHVKLGWGLKRPNDGTQ